MQDYYLNADLWLVGDFFQCWVVFVALSNWFKHSPPDPDIYNPMVNIIRAGLFILFNAEDSSLKATYLL